MRILTLRLRAKKLKPQAAFGQTQLSVFRPFEANNASGTIRQEIQYVVFFRARVRCQLGGNGLVLDETHISKKLPSNLDVHPHLPLSLLVDMC